MALLIGWGLRWAELVSLKAEDLQVLEDHLVIADLNWKGETYSNYPRAQLGKGKGFIFRRANRTDTAWGKAITPKAIWHIVNAAATRAGFKNLAPHDLRRT